MKKNVKKTLSIEKYPLPSEKKLVSPSPSKSTEYQIYIASFYTKFTLFFDKFLKKPCPNSQKIQNQQNFEKDLHCLTDQTTELLKKYPENYEQIKQCLINYEEKISKQKKSDLFFEELHKYQKIITSYLLWFKN